MAEALQEARGDARAVSARAHHPYRLGLLESSGCTFEQVWHVAPLLSWQRTRLPFRRRAHVEDLASRAVVHRRGEGVDADLRMRLCRIAGLQPALHAS